MTKNQIRFIVEGALIAAAYVGLTFISNLMNLAYGPIQFRISEVLTILPLFTTAAIPGLAIGCFISNIVSSVGPIDMVFGTLATVIAALLTYALRGICFRGLPLLGMLPPVVVNAVIIGIEINLFFLQEGASLWGFVSSAFTVGLGELGVCYLLGIPLYITLKKYSLFEEKK